MLTSHGSNHIFIAGYCDRAAYNRDDRRHRADLHLALKLTKDLFPQQQVKGLWVNEHCETEEVNNLGDAR